MENHLCIQTKSTKACCKAYSSKDSCKLQSSVDACKQPQYTAQLKAPETSLCHLYGLHFWIRGITEQPSLTVKNPEGILDALETNLRHCRNFALIIRQAPVSEVSSMVTNIPKRLLIGNLLLATPLFDTRSGLDRGS